MVSIKVAIVGSRNITTGINLEEYVPKNTTLIISGGAKGVDTLAEQYAKAHGVRTMIFLPDYDKYGKVAPIIRNKLIAEHADYVIAIWDGVSPGTKFTIEYAKKKDKLVDIVLIKD